MMRPVILFVDPKTDWARLARATLRNAVQLYVTSSRVRLRRLVQSHASRVLVIIDTKQADDSESLIMEIKGIPGDIVILAATSSQTWDDTVTYIKAGASDILFKTMEPEKLLDALKGK